MSLFQLCHLNGDIRRGGLVFGVLDLGRGVWVLALPESLRCVPEKDSLLSQCLSLPRTINGY